MHCQRAVEKRLIPTSFCKKKDSWYVMWEFDYYFGVKSGTIRKFAQQGKFKMISILSENERANFELFLIKDNINVLPNKPKSRIVTENSRSRVKYEKVDFSLITG